VDDRMKAKVDPPLREFALIIKDTRLGPATNNHNEDNGDNNNNNNDEVYIYLYMFIYK
jgi:hypothetical protein